MTPPFFPKSGAGAPTGTVQLQDARNDFNVAFIHSRLDDYGLTAPQFRVYSHLARRAGLAGAYPAIKSIAETCKLHPQTVRQALRFLEQHCLITREERPGTTPIRWLTPVAQWKSLPSIAGNPCELDGGVSVSESPHPKPIQDHPYDLDGAEGYPVKGDPTKVFQNPHSPPKGECVNGSKVSASVSTWEEEIYAAYPKKIGKPAALRAIRGALGKDTPAFLLDRTRLFALTYNGETRFIPHPATWFNQQRFNDDPATWRSSPPSKGVGVPPRQFAPTNYNQPV